MPGIELVVERDLDLADALRQAALATGPTPEGLAAEAVTQAYETGLRHRVLIERMEAVDAQIAAIARFVEEATAPAEGGIDLDRRAVQRCVLGMVRTDAQQALPEVRRMATSRIPAAAKPSTGPRT